MNLNPNTTTTCGQSFSKNGKEISIKSIEILEKEMNLSEENKKKILNKKEKTFEDSIWLAHYYPSEYTLIVNKKLAKIFEELREFRFYNYYIKKGIKNARLLTLPEKYKLPTLDLKQSSNDWKFSGIYGFGVTSLK